ncbi:hypothetical protein B0J18DRAFT_171291 [Chaetomium sp. MPI-SDFR-AT-0129]|nr:hypothetical protein B0J18DRAFT_171291 [Chaetomium sp. MPI-SDFR-AT-0129]
MQHQRRIRVAGKTVFLLKLFWFEDHEDKLVPRPVRSPHHQLKKETNSKGKGGDRPLPKTARAQKLTRLTHTHTVCSSLGKDAEESDSKHHSSCACTPALHYSRDGLEVVWGRPGERDANPVRGRIHYTQGETRCVGSQFNVSGPAETSRQNSRKGVPAKVRKEQGRWLGRAVRRARSPPKGPAVKTPQDAQDAQDAQAARRESGISESFWWCRVCRRTGNAAFVRTGGLGGCLDVACSWRRTQSDPALLPSSRIYCGISCAILGGERSRCGRWKRRE